MAYSLNEPIDKLISRKEFRSMQYHVNRSKLRSNIDFNITDLDLFAHQLFAKRLFAPQTPYKRGLLKYDPGAGKTLAAAQVALTYGRIYQEMFKAGKKKIPNVYVLGFTQTIIKDELLKFPELGFITYSELSEIVTLQQIVIDDPQNKQVLEKLNQKLDHYKTRISLKSRGGYFKFFGYQEIINALFDLPKNYDLKNLRKDIESGVIQVNKKILESFRDSLIIADEIHITYNTHDMNNYGVAIQFILDHFGPEIAALFLTATVANNTPAEIIDLGNMMSPPHKKVKKSDFFHKKNEKIITAKLDDLTKIFAKNTLFWEQTGENFPSLEFVGKKYGDIRLIVLSNSEIHQRTYNEEFVKKKRSPGPGDFTIFDGVYPNPENPKIGIYTIQDIQSKIASADSKWLAKHGLEVNYLGKTPYLGGSFFRRANIGKYFNKFANLIDSIDGSLTKNPRQKIMIFHPYIFGSGVMAIQELLKQNGYIDEFSAPNPSTFCSICHKTFAAHSSSRFSGKTGRETHKFMPSRFVIVHSRIPNLRERNASLRKFNSPNNIFGENFQFFIGARLIEQAYNFKEVREQYDVQHTINISRTVQLVGRVDRTNSHARLPPEDRKVKVFIYSSKTNELQIYKNKLEDYKEIKIIDRAINKAALNNFTNMMTTRVHQSNKPFPSLPFKPMYAPTSRTTFATYYAYGYSIEEVNEITRIIRRLFVTIPVWKVGDLKASIRNPPFATAFDPSQFDERNIELSLTQLSNLTFTEDNSLGKLQKTEPRKIILVGEYLILCALSQGQPKLGRNCFFKLRPMENFENIPIPRNINIAEKMEIELGKLKAELESSARGDRLMTFATAASPELHQFILNSLIGYKDQQTYFTKDKLGASLTQFRQMYRKLKVMPTEKSYIWNYNVYFANRLESYAPVPIKGDNKIGFIGYVENNEFKLRPTVQKVEEADARKHLRGSSCFSRPKDELQGIYRALLKKNSEGMRVRDICYDIMAKLFDMQMAAGKGNTYFVLFNQLKTFN